MRFVLIIQFVVLFENLRNVFTQSPCGFGYFNVPSPPAPQCGCLKIIFFVPPGTTFMSSQKACLNADPRLSLLSFDGAAQQTAVEAAASQASSQASSYGISFSNIPVGLYIDNSGNVRHLIDQQTTPPINNVNGKCVYMLTSGNYATNGSCLQPVSQPVCTMACGNVPMPPSPTVGPDAVRCNDPNFNMNCQAGWINLGGLCYKSPVDSNTLVTYSQAVSACNQIGGWLPSFANLNEWQAVTNYVYTTGISGADSWAAPMWLGGTLSGTTATWNDGTPWSFQYWAPSQPTGSTSCMYWSVGQGDYWSGGSCSLPGVAFCQQYTLCTTTTPPMTTTVQTTTTTTTTTITSTSSPSTTTTTTTTASTSSSSPSTTITTTTPPTTTTTTPSTTSTTAAPTSTSSPSTTTSTSTTSASTTATQTSKRSSVTATSLSPSSALTTFAQRCNANVYSSYMNGICFTLYTTNGYTNAANACVGYGQRLSIVRSADVAELIIGLYKRMYPTATNMSSWIGVPYGKASTYNVLQNAVTSDGRYRLAVNVTNAQCIALKVNSIGGGVASIIGNVSCSSSLAYVCETAPKFERKGCGEWLKGPVVLQTTTATNLTDCATRCVSNDYCFGVNYNPVSRTCQTLKNNTSTDTLVCGSSWEYFERTI